MKQTMHVYVFFLGEDVKKSLSNGEKMVVLLLL